MFANKSSGKPDTIFLWIFYSYISNMEQGENLATSVKP